MSLYLGDTLISGAEQFVGESRNIGQIIPSTIPLTDAGLHLLDGALIQGSGIYSAFVDYIASIYDASANYFCTEADWQTSVTNYGVCGKFVYDNVNNTVRLPKYSNKIYTKGITSTAPVVGNGMALGLTNGTNNFGLVTRDDQYNFTAPNTNAYGTFVGTPSGNVTVGPAWASIGVTSDGSKSGLIAQLSNITTSLEGYYYIVIATSTKTNIEVDIDEIATDLNGKADVDLTNITNTANSKMASASMPSDIRISLTIGAAGATYTAPADGWYWVTGTSGYIYLTNTSAGLKTMCQLDTNIVGECYIPVKKNDTVTLWWLNSTISTFYFIYAEGSKWEAQ